ncbi:uncharacterized protein METZ01_LOCUS229836 [marine metagenome]|uniref:Uncharacterized protein n=1 Tax=marine metagenome TaxID=408172 RepID=A0A382GQ14_9ZZZZ
MIPTPAGQVDRDTAQELTRWLTRHTAVPIETGVD